MSDNYNYCHVVGKTDVGRKRAANEDNMYNAITANGLVSVVCDGMGGHVGGATASKIAVTTIIEHLNNVYYEDPRIAIGESIDEANRAIIQKTKEQPELAGMGSTCVLLIVRDGKVYYGHVGDSRIYLVRSKRIVQLTKDHSYVQMLVDHGEITKEQAEHHPRKNEITNALGIPNMSPATVAENAVIPEAGDCFVLCSDGLSGMVPDNTICKVISNQLEMTAQERVNRLVDLANENGGVDNITVQLVEFSVTPKSVGQKNRIPAWAKIACGIFLLAVLAIGTYFILKGDKPTETEQDNKEEAVAEIVSRCDTTQAINLDRVNFKKHGKIVDLVFSDSSLEMIINGVKGSYVEHNVSFDPNSIEVLVPKDNTVNIIRNGNKHWLAFTDVKPAKTVEFCITTSDGQKVYRYLFEITKGTAPVKKPDSKPSVVVEPKEEPAKPAEEDKVIEVVAAPDTLFVKFEYDSLNKDTELVFRYILKTELVFNGETKDIGEMLFEKITEDPGYNSLYWTKEMKEVKLSKEPIAADSSNSKDSDEVYKELSFKFKGESSKMTHTFTIRCKKKDFKEDHVISIEILPKKDIVESVEVIEVSDEKTSIDSEQIELETIEEKPDSLYSIVPATNEGDDKEI